MVLSVPPMIIGLPATLLTITTAMAPAFCAFNTFTVKLQFALSIKAIFPVTELTGAPVQASCKVPAALSL